MIDTIMILVPIIVAYVLVLVASVFVIKKKLMSDTMRAVNTMKQVEAEVRKKEEVVRKKIEDHEKEFAKKKAEAEEDLARQKEESAREVASLRETTLEEAKLEGDRIIEQAKRNEEKMRKQLELEMEEKAVDYAGQIFKLVFSERTNAELNKQFIGELLDALTEIEPGSITVDTSSAEFITSHHLEDEQKKRLEDLLEEKFAAKIKVEETIQEDLLSGLILKMGSLEIDGSLVNRYQEAVAEVKKSM